MKLLLRLLCACALGTAMVAVTSGVAGAASPSTTCNGVLAPGTYQRVVVPEGVTCLSDGPVTIRGGPFDITWTTIEDSRINGSVTIEGYNGFWLGFIRNTVYGSVNLNGNVLPDPDGNEYATNTIHGSLNCAGNSPAQIGDSEGSPNVVTGAKTGQCANL